MPVDILLDKNRRTMRTHAWGPVDLADFIESLEKTMQLIDSGMIDDSWGQIIDLTDVSSVDEISEADVMLIATQSPWPPGSKRAVVVTDDKAQKLARIYQTQGSEKGHNIELVESIDDAEKWLNK